MVLPVIRAWTVFIGHHAWPYSESVRKSGYMIGLYDVSVILSRVEESQSIPDGLFISPSGTLRPFDFAQGDKRAIG